MALRVPGTGKEVDCALLLPLLPRQERHDLLLLRA
jgi:hypothetical protein